MVDSDGHFGTHTHLEMWKHYDDLRQQKFSGFLTANSILLTYAGSGLYRMLDCHIRLVCTSRNRVLNQAITLEESAAQNLIAIHRSSINSWRFN